jgi:hypothetical protein
MTLRTRASRAVSPDKSDCLSSCEKGPEDRGAFSTRRYRQGAVYLIVTCSLVSATAEPASLNTVAVPAAIPGVKGPGAMFNVME